MAEELKKDPEQKTDKKDDNQLSDSEIKWINTFFETCSINLPFSHQYNRSDRVYEGLFKGLSSLILLDESPQIDNYEGTPKILEKQFQEENEYWKELFNHFLELNPQYIQAEANSKEYLNEQCDNFWFWLYKPLQDLYRIFLEDIITYNYSPYSIDINLFK